jgi:hypothetical protein
MASARAYASALGSCTDRRVGEKLYRWHSTRKESFEITDRYLANAIVEDRIRELMESPIK